MRISKISDNYRNSIRRKIQLSFNVEHIWKAISKESNLELFHPYCKRNPILIWNDDGHEDEIHYMNGFVLKRKFVAWKKNVGYDLVIGNQKHEHSFVSWRLTEFEKPEICSLSISIYPYLFNLGLKFYDRIPFELYIRPKLSSYLDSVLGGLKWHLDNNKPTPKNHFGPHKWFS